MARITTERRSKWLPEYREGYESAEKAIKQYGWRTSYDSYQLARQSDEIVGYFGAGFLSALCDLDPNKGRARIFSGNASRTPFGLR